MLFFCPNSYNDIGGYMINQINTFIQDKSFHFTVYEDKIYIVNFKRIISLEETYISISTNHQKIKIMGNHFLLNKLLNNELLISGEISKIEVIHD